MHKRLLAGIFAAQAALVLAGCGSEGSDYTIADGPLSGKHNGQSWTLGAAYTDGQLSTPDKFFTNFYLTDPGGCDAFGGSGDGSLLMRLPTTPGEYEFGLSLNMTFAFQDQNGDFQNFAATTGKLEITEVTDTMVKGGLYAIYNNDPNFEVSGQFQATVCPGATP